MNESKNRGFALKESKKGAKTGHRQQKQFATGDESV